MPKLKTKKTAKKRFKETGSGKIMRRHARTSHLKSKQSAAKKRRKSRSAKVAKSNSGKVRKMIG
jgi:large subunit ribosomal protein L35